MKKAQVEIGLLQMIEILLAIALIGGFSYYIVAPLLKGLFAPEEDRASEVAFDSLVTRINQLIADPSPLAYTTIPYYLGKNKALIGYRRGPARFVTCLSYEGGGRGYTAPREIPSQTLTLGYPGEGLWASVCAEPNCFCLKKAGEFVKCASTTDYDIYTSFADTPSQTRFRDTSRGVPPENVPDDLLRYEYGSLKDVAFFGPFAGSSCTAAMDVFPLYIEKHEFPVQEGDSVSFRKVIYLSYAGDPDRITERITNQVRLSVEQHTRIADTLQANRTQESIVLMERLLRYPNIEPYLTHITKNLCSYEFTLALTSHNYRRALQRCEEARRLLPQDVDITVKLAIVRNFQSPTA